MVEAATMFRKSGFNDADAATLAKVAAQYQNVADTAISAEDAAASIVSQIRAFGKDASFATQVIDAYNEVANRFSVGTNDLSNAMEIASSGMATYGNSFQQILGLVTSGTEIMVGRSSQVARGLSTIASRIVKNQDALAEYGITVKNVDGSLKSTFDVLSELKPKWDSMTDAQRTALGDTIAGTNQYKVLAAVMQNFEHATDATKVALESAGSAAHENERYMESLEAKVQAVKAEFEDFSNRVLSKELVSGFLDAGQAVLQFVNTDFGASLTRIAGVGTTVASTLGLIGTMGAKLVLVSKQLQNAGGATGLLGLLTTPKTVLAIGGVVAGLTAMFEIMKAIDGIDDKKLTSLSDTLQATNDKIAEMSADGSEYDTLIKKAGNLTEQEEARLGILQAQLDTLKKQSAEENKAYYTEWQKQQQKGGSRWEYGEGDGTGTTFTSEGQTYTVYTTTKAEEATRNLSAAIVDLQQKYNSGNISQQAYIAGLQNEIDGAQETYDNILALKDLYAETGDEQYKLAQTQEIFTDIIDTQKEVVAGLGAEYAQNSEGLQQFGDAAEESVSSFDALYRILANYQDAVNGASGASEKFVNSLFNTNGELTEAAKQALSTSGSMASMAQSFIEAQQAQAQADFSALILAINEVGAAAAMTASQISSMMAMAGTPISGIDTEEGMARFKGYAKAQGYSDVQSYIKAVGTKNYQKKMEEYKKQLSQISSYVPSGGGGGGGGGSSSTKRDQEEVKTQTINTIEELREYLTDESTRLKLIDPDISKSDLQSTLSEVATIYQSYQDYLSQLKQQGFDETSQQYQQAEAEFAQFMAVLEELFMQIAQKGNYTIEELFQKFQDAIGGAGTALDKFGSKLSNVNTTAQSATDSLTQMVKAGKKLQTINVFATDGSGHRVDLNTAFRSGAVSAEDIVSGYESAWDTIRAMGDSINEQYDAAVKDAINNASAESAVAQEVADEYDRQNQLLEDKIALEEKLEALEKAKQRRMLVYSEGRFQYMQDADAISSAQAEYQETYRDVEQRQIKELMGMIGQESSDFFAKYFGEGGDVSGYEDILREHLMEYARGKLGGSVLEGISDKQLYSIFGEAMKPGEAYEQLKAAAEAAAAAREEAAERRAELKKQIREENVKYYGVDTDFGEKIKNAQSQNEVAYWTQLRDTKQQMIKEYREAYGDEAASKYFGTDVSKQDTWASNRDLYKEAYESGSKAWWFDKEVLHRQNYVNPEDEWTEKNPELTQAQYNAATAVDMEDFGDQRLYNRIFSGAITKDEIQDLYNKSKSDISKGYLLNLASEMHKAGYKGYARGTRHANRGLSLVGENGPELRVLNHGDGILPSGITDNLWRWGSMTPKDMLSSLAQRVQNWAQTLNISNITLPNVRDAQSFVSGLRELAQQYVTRRS